MPETEKKPKTEIDIPTMNVKLKGIFNFAVVMQSIKDWFDDNSYKFEEPTHKWKTGDGIEIDIKIKGDRKINEYVKENIELSVRTWDMKEIEIIKDGQKTKTNEGRIAIEIGGKLNLDWQKRFSGNKFLQNLQDFFHKFIIRKDIGDQWEDNLLFKIIELTKTIQEKIGHEAPYG